MVVVRVLCAVCAVGCGCVVCGGCVRVVCVLCGGVCVVWVMVWCVVVVMVCHTVCAVWVLVCAV